MENTLSFVKVYAREYLDRHPIPEYFTDKFTDEDDIGQEMYVEDNRITVYAYKNDERIEVISYYILDYDIVEQVMKLRYHK